MNYAKILTCVFLMALVTYLPRMIPLTVMKRKIKNRFIRSFLFYVPYAVLAAMTFPEILYSTASLISGICGLCAGLFLAYQEKGLLMVAVVSSCVVFIVEQCLVLI